MEVEEVFRVIFSKLDELSDRLDTLENLPSISCDENDFNVYSLADASMLLKIHNGPNEAKFRQKVIDSLIQNSVRDLPEVYHNFIVDLYNVDNLSVVKLCNHVLTFAPHHRDILADGIKACRRLADWNLGMDFYTMALSIPKDRWNDKLFLAASLFLISRFNAYPENNCYFDEASKLIDDHIKYLPHDEHGYDLKAILYISAQRRQDAIDYLTDVIRNGYSDEKIHNEKTKVVATQCCMTLLELLDDSCDYDLIIEVCDIGLRYTHDQMSARISGFAYRRALAYDAKAYLDGFRQESITAALAEMQSAHTLVTNDPKGVQANEDSILEQKYEALRRYAGNNYIPLKKRSLTIADN